jgi:hypothetical protein
MGDDAMSEVNRKCKECGDFVKDTHEGVPFVDGTAMCMDCFTEDYIHYGKKVLDAIERGGLFDEEVETSDEQWFDDPEWIEMNRGEPFEIAWSLLKGYEAHWSLDIDENNTPVLDVKPAYRDVLSLYPHNELSDTSLTYPFEEWDEEDWQGLQPLIQTFLELKREKLKAGLGSGSSWEPDVDVQEADDVIQSFVDHMRYLSREASAQGPLGPELYPNVVPEAKAILDKWKEAASKHARTYGGI